jgi:glycosyltransferase involved in cell wall biosynthesis
VFEDTIATVLGQTYDDWEWILTDDHSPSDRVVPRLRELAAGDPRVRVNERTQNGGIVAAPNDALAGARGEFVALLDHDDVLELAALSMKVRRAGLRLVWLHDVVLHHLGSVGHDDAEAAEWERAAITARWGDREGLPERYANNRRPRRRSGPATSRRS